MLGLKLNHVSKSGHRYICDNCLNWFWIFYTVCIIICFFLVRHSKMVDILYCQALYMDHSWYGLSHWETTLQFHAVFYWLSPYPGWFLLYFTQRIFVIYWCYMSTFLCWQGLVSNNQRPTSYSVGIYSDNHKITSPCNVPFVLISKESTLISTLRQKQNGRHFPVDIFECIFQNEHVCIYLKVSL